MREYYRMKIRTLRDYKPGNMKKSLSLVAHPRKAGESIHAIQAV